MHDVFISYCTENLPQAQALTRLLEDHGIRCWFAPSAIRGHEDFTEKIPNAIRGAKAFLLLMSDAAQHSKWVKRELGEADACSIPVYTLFLEDCPLEDSFQFVLRFQQHYPAALGWEEQTRRLLRELKEDLSNTQNPTEEIPGKAYVKPPVPKRSRTTPWLIGALCLALAVAAVLCLPLFAPEDKGGSFVIWNPAYSTALTAKEIHEHYLAGETVMTQGSTLASYSNACVFLVTYFDDGSFTLSQNGVTLGVQEGYNGVGMGGSYTHDRWKTEAAGDGKVLIRNVKSGYYLEWYAQKNNWSTHGKITDNNRDLFLLEMIKTA